MASSTTTLPAVWEVMSIACSSVGGVALDDLEQQIGEVQAHWCRSDRASAARRVIRRKRTTV